MAQMAQWVCGIQLGCQVLEHAVSMPSPSVAPDMLTG